jgi:hypothetical protein
MVAQLTLDVLYPLQYVSDKASELTNTASKEANKDVAKDSDNSLSSRASAATVSGSSHSSTAE